MNPSLRPATSSKVLRVGILGGGQLARMLCIEGFKMGLEMHVLSAKANDPAAQATRFWHEGDVNAPIDVKRFFSEVDVVTFESEFLSEKVLLEAEAATRTMVQPQVRLMSELSDRLKQKAWLERFRIPTSRFSGIVNEADAMSFVAQATSGKTAGKNTDKMTTKKSTQNKNYVTVIKKRRHGYDGYGTFLIRDKNHLREWLQQHKDNLNDFIIEDFQPFKRELAIQFAAHRSGEIYTYPLVEWQAENSRCLWVKGPVTTRFKKDLTQLTKKVTKALTESRYVGVIAFEIFETAKGLVVNEVAPRVHNSAHYSLEALSFNQFRAHINAVVGFNAPARAAQKVKPPGFAMVNLLGEGEHDLTQLNTLTAGTSFLHWYGKHENREGRKMGHITTLAATGDRALKEALRLRKGMKL